MELKTIVIDVTHLTVQKQVVPGRVTNQQILVATARCVDAAQVVGMESAVTLRMRRADTTYELRDAEVGVVKIVQDENKNDVLEISAAGGEFKSYKGDATAGGVLVS